mmetsp:Transcript_104698/g.254113  ORF Transcript_104698/g.254113 Transcript_104698/m.254113 type:complete len:374 (-) Transcript_104698:266-1387(-)
MTTKSATSRCRASSLAATSAAPTSSDLALGMAVLEPPLLVVLLSSAVVVAFVDCSSGSASMPFKKGVSASLHATSASSAFSTFSAATVSICCMAMPRPSIFFFAARPGSLIWFNSSFSAPPAAVRSFCPRSRSALGMAMVAGATTSVSFCCSVEYSESAVSCTSGAYLLAFCRLRFFCFRASMVLLCASEAAVSLSSTALFSMSCSGGSVTVGSGMAEMASLESSAMDTSSRTSGRVSAKSLASFSSDFFFRSCISACLLAAAALCCAFWTCPLTFVISAVKLACRDLALTMSLERSPTALLPAFLASSMSALSDFDTSPSMATCFTSRSRSPPPPPLEVRRLASTRASAASARRCRAAGGTPWRGWALAFLD